MHAKTHNKKSMAHNAAEALRESGDDIQDHVTALWETGRDRTVACMQATDRAIRDNPYEAVGIALGIGLLAGLLLSRDRD